MPEIESELDILINVETIHLLTGNSAGDRIMIDPVTLTKEQAATLAWLGNHVKGTKLQVRVSKE